MNKQHHFTCKIKSTSFVNKQCSICHTRSFSGSLQPGTLNTYHHYCRHWHLTICLNYQSTPLPLSKFHKCPAIVFIIFNNWSGGIDVASSSSTGVSLFNLLWLLHDMLSLRIRIHGHYRFDTDTTVTVDSLFACSDAAPTICVCDMVEFNIIMLLCLTLTCTNYYMLSIISSNWIITDTVFI